MPLKFDCIESKSIIGMKYHGNELDKDQWAPHSLLQMYNIGALAHILHDARAVKYK